METDPWIIALIAGLAHGVFVFFKSFQQKNVIGNHYWWVIGTSYFMSTTEVFVVSIVAVSAVQAAATGDVDQMIRIALALGTFGGLGAIGGMWTHRRFVQK